MPLQACPVHSLAPALTRATRVSDSGMKASGTKL